VTRTPVSSTGQALKCWYSSRTSRYGWEAFALKVAPLDYPGHFEVRYVSFNGGIRWKRDWVNVSIVCPGEYVGLEEIDNGVWNVWPSQTRSLARRTHAIEDANGQLKRRNPNPPSRL
jgi:hypothetical protein